jgi:hypothetical protein
MLGTIEDPPAVIGHVSAFTPHSPFVGLVFLFGTVLRPLGVREGVHTAKYERVVPR